MGIVTEAWLVAPVTITADTASNPVTKASSEVRSARRFGSPPGQRLAAK
jgi:hypothetical protein